MFGRSFDLSTNIPSNIIDEMKTEISTLKSNLASTQGELENIILENIDLKKQLTLLNQEIIVLKQLCTSPNTAFTTSSKKNLNKRKLTDCFQNTPTKGQKKDNSMDTSN